LVVPNGLIALSGEGTKRGVGESVAQEDGPPVSRVMVYDLATGDEIDRFAAADAEVLMQLALSWDGSMVAYGDNSGSVAMWDRKAKRPRDLGEMGLRITGLASAPTAS
jgi:hypothetical protein